MKRMYRYRSAVSDWFVSKTFALINAYNTVRERIKQARK